MAAKKKKKKAKTVAKARKAVATKKKKAPARKAAKKTKAKKASKPAAKKAKKTAKKKVVKAAAKKAAPKKAAKKKVVRKKKQAVGEGDYAATRRFDRDEANFVEKNRAEIPAMGKAAEDALDGPEGDSLREAEASAAGRSRDTF
jgi:hypothetical protein